MRAHNSESIENISETDRLPIWSSMEIGFLIATCLFALLDIYESATLLLFHSVGSHIRTGMLMAYLIHIASAVISIMGIRYAYHGKGRWLPISIIIILLLGVSDILLTNPTLFNWILFVGRVLILLFTFLSVWRCWNRHNKSLFDEATISIFVYLVTASCFCCLSWYDIAYMLRIDKWAGYDEGIPIVAFGAPYCIAAILGWNPPFYGTTAIVPFYWFILFTPLLILYFRKDVKIWKWIKYSVPIGLLIIHIAITLVLGFTMNRSTARCGSGISSDSFNRYHKTSPP